MPPTDNDPDVSCRATPSGVPELCGCGCCCCFRWDGTNESSRPYDKDGGDDGNIDKGDMEDDGGGDDDYDIDDVDNDDDDNGQWDDDDAMATTTMERRQSDGDGLTSAVPPIRGNNQLMSTGWGGVDEREG